MCVECIHQWRNQNATTCPTCRQSEDMNRLADFVRDTLPNYPPVPAININHDFYNYLRIIEEPEVVEEPDERGITRELIPPVESEVVEEPMFAFKKCIQYAFIRISMSLLTPEAKRINKNISYKRKFLNKQNKQKQHKLKNKTLSWKSTRLQCRGR